MADPFEKLKKLKGRSLKEFRARGEQALAAYGEQIGFGGKIPGDQEFLEFFDESFFAGKTISAANIFVAFFDQGKKFFFQSFADQENTLKLFRAKFGGSVTASIIEKAERIIEGRFDLLGYQNLDFGAPVDWHFEPVSQIRSPRKHWKQFDELATTETGDKKIVWELNRHQHFFTLGVAFSLTGDERYAATFAQQLESWMQENPPGFGVNWISSLEVSFRLISWIWAFHFFEKSENLTAELFWRALKFLYLHGRHIEKYLSTYYSPNTHLTGEALGLYYLGTQFKFFKKSEDWRQRGEEILLGELDRQIYDDGVYFEQSTWYQRYTVDFYTQFFILKHLDSQQTPEKLSKKLQQQLDFLMAITRPDGTTPLIGDDDGGRCLPLSETNANDFRYTLANGAILFARGDYKFVAGDLFEESIWLFGAKNLENFATLPATAPAQTSKNFPAGGYYVMRDGWTETDNYLLIDGGNMGAASAGHSHADALAVDCAAGGKTFLVDPGTYTYHESLESRNYFRSTVAHNTLSINEKSSSEPGGKFSWQTLAKTSVDAWIAQPRFDFFEGRHDGFQRFLHAPAVHQRSVLFLKNDYWIVRDYVETGDTNDYQINFHFAADTHPIVEQSGDGRFFVNDISDKRAGMRIFTFGDHGGWQRGKSWIAPRYGQRLDAPFLKFVSTGVGTQEFFTFLFPVNSKNPPDVFQTEVGGGRAFVVEHLDYRDLLIFSDGEQLIRTEFFDTNFRFCWARLLAGESLPEEFVMTHGTSFFLNGKEIVNYPQSLEFVTARRLGNRLNVQTSENLFSLNLPQFRSNVRIMKNPE